VRLSTGWAHPGEDFEAVLLGMLRSSSITTGSGICSGQRGLAFR
jgi:hypothetical protein